MNQKELHALIKSHILRRKEDDRAMLVGIDGVDTSGKTSLADAIARELEIESSLTILRASIDGFHNPASIRARQGKLSPQGYFEDSFNKRALIDLLLLPLKQSQGMIQTKVFDYKVDEVQEGDQVEVDVNTILVFDGVFLHCEELRDYWDFSVFLHVDFDKVLQRALIRDSAIMDGEDQARLRYESRYIPGQKIYLESCKPQELSDLVVDNNDFEGPFVVSGA